jgi:hypothetical protein
MPQGQVTALAVGAGGRVFAATSNPGALWLLGPQRAARGELMSQALDAKRMARFGRVLWRGRTGGGHIELRTRSGNTDPPDTTWSEWTGGGTGPEGARSESPSARYLQLKLTLAGGDPEVQSLEAAWREVNLPPRVEDVVVAPQGQAFREGEMQPRSEPVTQVLPGGQKVEYSIPSGTTPRALRDLPAWARGLRTVQWRSSDPNGDPLRYRVEMKSEDGGGWIKVADDLEVPSVTWDTNPLPDGRYRVRVIATDAPGNAVGEFTAHAGGGGIELTGRGSDARSNLTRIEVALDEDDWRPVTPEGGLTDAREMSFHALLAPAAPGEHTVSARVVDAAGNTATRALRVTVPAGR